MGRKQITITFTVDQSEIRSLPDGFPLETEWHDPSTIVITTKPSVLGEVAMVLFKGAKAVQVIDVKEVEKDKLIHHPGQMTIESYENVADHVGKEVMGNG